MSAVRSAALAGIILVSPALPQSAQSAEYPTKPIRIVVAYPAGGGLDVVARVIGTALGQRLPQPVVVENRPGASGMIGTEYVAKAAPDGHTLVLAAADTHSINPSVYANIRYDATRDFAPIALIGNLPMTLVAHPAVPAKSVSEFVTYVKANPDKVSFASWGIGSSSHVAMETLMLPAGLKMLHVPFTGAAPAINAVTSGEANAMMVTLPTVESLDQVGKVRILGVTPIQRPAGAPTYPMGDLPAHLAVWVGLLGQANLPPEIVTRLNGEIRALMPEPQVRAALMKVGLEPVADVSSAQDFARFLATQSDLWGRTAREAKISVELQ